MVLKYIFYGVVALLIMLFAGDKIIDTLFDNAASIDACLDQGGKWNYELESCEFE